MNEAFQKRTTPSSTPFLCSCNYLLKENVHPCDNAETVTSKISKEMEMDLFSLGQTTSPASQSIRCPRNLETFLKKEMAL